MPEIAGLSVEEINRIFSGPWIVVGGQYRRRLSVAMENHVSVLESEDPAVGFELTKDDHKHPTETETESKTVKATATDTKVAMGN